MSLIGSIEPFDESKNDFKTYIERFEQLLKCNKVEEEMKLPLFITLCGGTTFSTLKNLCVPTPPTEKSYQSCIDLLKKHFNPEPLVVLERFRFHKRDQKPNESISEYIVELKKISSTCSFNTFLSEALRDRFICGIQSEVIKKKLLSEEKLTFESACKIALCMELTSSETRLMHETSLASSSIATVSSPSSSQTGLNFRRQHGYKVFGGNNNSVNNYQKSNNRQSTNDLSTNFSNKDSARRTWSPCERCGRRHDARSCPAVNWVCFSCQRVGHTSRVCAGKRRNVNAVLESELAVPATGSEDDFLEESNVSSINGIDYQVNHNHICNITGRKDDEHPCFINIKVNNVPMRAEIDTGACASIISSSVFFRYFKDVAIVKTDKPYKSVTSHVVPVVGTALVMVEHNNVKKNVELIIQKNHLNVPLLVGRTWLKVLFPSWQDSFKVKEEGHSVKTVKGNSDNSNVIDKYKSRFPRVFGNNPSTIIGYKAGVTIKQNCSPIFCRAYAVPFALRAKLEAEYSKLKSEGVIFPVSSSEWASPVVIVSKKDGGIRICVDFRVSLNKVIESDHYPLPNIDDIITSMSRKTVFTILDLRGAYQQLELFEESKVYFTINTHVGLFRFNKLTYGVKTAPSIFQRTMDEILRGIANVSCYIDDVIISGTDYASCKQSVEEVLSRLNSVNVRVNLSKCKFFVHEVEYLGFLLTGKGVRPCPTKVDALQNAPIPTDVTKLKAYLGLLNFYRQFVPMQSAALAPLYRLTRKGVPFEWSTECQMSFLDSKRSLSKKSLLSYYDPTKQLVLSCDASCYGVGAVLSHMENNMEVPIAFASATLTPAERNYSQVEKEALAIIFGVKRFHKFLFGRQFILYTDNMPLKTIFDPNKRISSTSCARLQRWSIILSGYTYTIRYKKSQDMASCDALSRLPLSTVNTNELSDTLINAIYNEDSVPLDFKDVAKATQMDPVLCKVLELVRVGWTSHVADPALQPFFCKREHLSIEHDCIVWGVRVIIPRSLQNYVLYRLHENHPGVVKMKLLARSCCWWPGIDIDLEKKAKSCEQCQKFQSSNAAEIIFEGWPKYQRPWTRLHADFLHLFGKNILLIVDSTSKWLDLYLMRITTASEVIAKFRRSFSIFGIPQYVVTDNGPPFSSTQFIKWLGEYGVEAKKSPPYFPQANGQAEAEVKVVKRAISKSIGCWSEGRTISDHEMEQHIDLFLFYYRTTPSPTTQKSPSDFLLRSPPRTFLNQLKPPLGQTHFSISPTNSSFYFPDKMFSPGDRVWYRLKDQWVQAVISQVLSKSRYLVDMKGITRVVHRHQLRSAGINVDELRSLPSYHREDHQEHPALDSTAVIPTTTEEPAVCPPIITEARPQRERHAPNRLNYKHLGDPNN